MLSKALRNYAKETPEDEVKSLILRASADQIDSLDAEVTRLRGKLAELSMHVLAAEKVVKALRNED